MSDEVSITVSGIFDILTRALNEAVEHHGDPAKAFAWDVNAFFHAELGRYLPTPGDQP